MSLSNQRIVYLNGAYLPENEAVIPIKDQGFKYGDGVFDTTRTFGHKIFKLHEHLERFEKSLKYLNLDPGLSIKELARITEEVVARNLPLLNSGDDYWV
ncbi:MAG: aminotransferase class IV, partial [Alphaproteobacteria bacterium]|nr:aminotransferase class IV [Alphaproteobacteria bacterium]